MKEGEGVQLTPDGPVLRLLRDSNRTDRSFFEDESYYCNTCGVCLRDFTGSKHRSICKVCTK